MTRRGHAAAAALIALAAACSDPDETRVSPETADEHRALAEARAMIPADELAPEQTTSPTSEETSKP